MIDRKTVKVILFGSSAVLIGFLIGALSFGLGSESGGENQNDFLRMQFQDEERSNFDKIIQNVNIDNMKKHLKYLTSIPHMAGTEGSKLAIDYVYNEWKQQGLDSIEMNAYDVYLDFPDDNKFNSLEIKKANYETETVYKIEEPTYDRDLNYSGIPKPFLAYSASGSNTYDEIYFVNYCREEDFIFLNKMNININGKLVICKYGKLFRGNKVKFAEKYGAKGVLLYDDPARSAPNGTLVYPQSEYLPKEGVQRGTLYNSDGDPTTPNYPSIDSSYRLDVNKANLPKIQAQVIGYGVAYEIFKLIDNNQEVTKEWKGDFNITYSYGGKLKNKRLITLNTYNKRKYEQINNIIGTIKGSIEPDRYIIIGNHRDSWSFGSVDPSSGTAALLEISRVFSYLKQKENWTPKRSIIFCSWDAEEYGLIGSVEWVEEYKKKLMANAVIYINVDLVLSGNYSYDAVSSPLVYDLIFDVIKSLKISPDETLFERWRLNDVDPKNESQPLITPYLGSGSDHMAFSQKAGVVCMDHNFVRNKNDPLFGSYAAYHSSYETYQLIEKHLDPNFLIARRVAESIILPFNCVRYAQELQHEFKKFQNIYQNDLDRINIDITNFKAAIDNLTKAAEDFHTRLDKISKKEVHLIRIYNDQLRNFEKAFLDPSGLSRSSYEHMIFAPSTSNSYGSDTFPSITDSIYHFKNNQSSSELREKIKLQLSIVTYAIQSASSILKEPTDFRRYF